jgi:recombinational DNA repair protein RecR
MSVSLDLCTCEVIGENEEGFVLSVCENCKRERTRMTVMDRKVTVCGACETAACWQGEYYCDHAEFSGTKEFTVRELHARPRGENSEYWFKDGNGQIEHRAYEAFRELVSSP